MCDVVDYCNECEHVYSQEEDTCPTCTTNGLTMQRYTSGLKTRIRTTGSLLYPPLEPQIEAILEGIPYI